MKSFSFNLRDALKNGLRSDVRFTRNLPMWEEVKNIKPSPFGAAKHIAITDPVVSPATTIAWPHPQLIHGEDVTLLAQVQGLYSFAEPNWTGSDLSANFFESGDPTTAETIDAGGGVWQWVFFKDQFYLTNGQQLVYRTPRESDSKILITTSAVLNCQAIGKDTAQERILFGGLSGTYFDSGQWPDDLFGLWLSGNDIGWQEQDTLLGTNWIMWGQPGGGSYDLPEQLIQGALGLLTAAQYAEVKEMIYEAIEAGIIGLRPMPTQGAIRVIKELGSEILVYTDDAVHILVRNGVQYSSGILKKVGVAGRGAVAGTEKEHLYVDTDSVLHRIASSANIERLGFEEHLSTLTAASIVISYDPDRGEYYISDGVKGYVFADDQLSETTRLTTGLFRTASPVGLIGVSEDVGNELGFSMRSLPWNGDRPGMKTVKQFDFQSENMSDLECRLHYNYDESSDYHATRWLPINREGVAFPFATAVNFKAEVRGNLSKADPRLENLRIHFQTPDRRYVRGGIGVAAERETG